MGKGFPSLRLLEGTEVFMVRHINGFFIEPDSVNQRRVDAIGEEVFEKIPVSNRDLVEPFTRFVQSSGGESFETLLKKWMEERRDGRVPIDCGNPENSEIPRSLREALHRAFKEVRGKTSTKKAKKKK